MIQSASCLTWVRWHHFRTCIICMLLNFKSQFLTATGCSENCLGICKTNAKSCLALWTPHWLLTQCIRAVPWTLQWCWDRRTLAVQYRGPPQGYWCSALKVAPGTLAYIFLNFPSCKFLCIILLLLFILVWCDQWLFCKPLWMNCCLCRDVVCRWTSRMARAMKAYWAQLARTYVLQFLVFSVILHVRQP